MKVLFCLLSAGLLAVANARSCCMPEKYDAQLGYSLTYRLNGDFNVVNYYMTVSYDADNEKVYTSYGGNWPLLPGVTSSLAHFKSKRFWLVFEDGTCQTGPFEPIPNTMPMCIPEDAGGVNYWLGSNVAVKSYDVANGSPTVRSYITVQEPTCNYLLTWTSWNDDAFEADLSATLTTAFQNMTIGNSDPNIFNPPECEESNTLSKKNIKAMGPLPGIFG